MQINKSTTINTGYSAVLRLEIAQHSRDYNLMMGLVKYLGCGATRVDNHSPAVNFSVTKFVDINNNIISLTLTLCGNKGGEIQDKINQDRSFIVK